jgi:hypothetical protein
MALAFVVGTVGATGGRTAAAQTEGVARSAAPEPVRIFAQVGTGLVEVGHAEVGAFLTPHLSIEAMASWAAVFGSHYGGGIMYSVGTAQGGRPPRHALLLGARLMVDPQLTFASHGDDLNSYLMLPVGYGFLADAGFYLRATAGLVVIGQRGAASVPPAGADSSESRVAVTGPMFTVSIGFAL